MGQWHSDTVGAAGTRPQHQWESPGKCWQEDLHTALQAGRNGKALPRAIPRDTHSSTRAQLSLCTPWDADFTSDTAAQALLTPTCCSRSTKVLPQYTCNIYFRIISGGKSSQEEACAAGEEVLRGEFLLLFSLSYLICKYGIPKL